MSDHSLETPSTSDAIYLALVDDIDDNRPEFTGDVFEDDRGLFMLVQHPCALRRGVELHDQILAAMVTASQLRSKWDKCSYKVMPLPQLRDDKDYAASFVDLILVTPTELQGAQRVANLSHAGVNLLLQRWVHHNSRVVVPTITYADVTIGPFDEAELIQDWASSRTGVDYDTAVGECDEWLSSTSTRGGQSRRMMLADRQVASTVRRDARKHCKSLNAS